MSDQLTALRDTLAEILGMNAVEDLVRLSGGASRETWSLTGLDGEGARLPIIVQRQSRPAPERPMDREAAVVRAAGSVGVPVPSVLAASARDDRLKAGFMAVSRVEGETIARRIQRDDQFAVARQALPGQFGTALARLHTLPPEAVPGLERIDLFEQYRNVLDLSGQAHPAFELAFRWLGEHRPPTTRTTVVHGDFRLGNVIVDANGLAAVIDWELAHVGDPMEDLGWVCVKAWRFGSKPPVAGIGEYEQLFAAYEAESGISVDPEIVHWWEVLGTLRWGIICITQAQAHLQGIERSHELAAIGRRVCENEYDLLKMLPPAMMATKDSP